MDEYRIITAPVIIPEKPDCDYQRGEPPLTKEQIQHFKESYDNYQIIDYDHQITQPDSSWYMKQLGQPVQSWISTTDTTYTNIAGKTETIPSGTWWLKARITDPLAIQQIDDRMLTAYSITVGNRDYCDKFIHNLNTAVKNQHPVQENTPDDNILAYKKTLIKDIIDPVGFTVSLTGMPCVGSALFAKRCYDESKQYSNKNGGENMTDESKENRFSVSELLGLQKLFANKNDEEENTKTEEETGDTPEKEPEQTESKEDKYVTKEELDQKFKSFKEEIVDIFDDKLEKVVEKLTVKKEEKEEEESEEDKNSDDGETANKHSVPSSQIDNTDDGHNLNTANKNTKTGKAKLMQALNRKPNGDYKFPRNI